MPNETSSASTLESIARSAYGQLVAILAAGSGDLSGAEDALGEAFLAALRQWPEQGVPDNPRAWLIRVAKRRGLDAHRRQQTRDRFAGELEHIAALAQVVEPDHPFPDERLKLLFVCAHPAIDPTARAPLSLQVVMGLSAERIASAFLTSPTAMSQRLVRAKTKIQQAGIPFAVPEPAEWPERLQFVMDSIYVAFNTGWEDAFSLEGGGRGLEQEAIWLGRLLVQLASQEPEAQGLLALMLHCHARFAARRVDGAFVPLPNQNAMLWSPALIQEADEWIVRASRQRDPGRFQLEAAIQSVHAQRAMTGRTEWVAIEKLYQALVQITPTLGARIGHAVAAGEVHGPQAGLSMLDRLTPDAVRGHQPYWAARAYLLRGANCREEARVNYQRAIGLTEDAAVRSFLIQEMGSA